MPPSFLFYISGHGYGHARRMTQVIRELLAHAPDTKVHIRSSAPARVFEPLPSQWIQPCDIDAGLAEKDALTIDREASLDRLLAFMARRDAIVAEEVSQVRRLKPDLIVADIPFLAGDVAAATGVPCVGISNFTWDWIYAHLFGPDARYAAMADSIAQGYAKISTLLELPFGRTCPAIARKISTPLIAMRSGREPEDILRQIGVSREDRRPRVLFGTRGMLAPGVLARAAAESPEFLFLCPHATAESLPPNALTLQLSPTLDFSDLLKISNIVVSKLGYGMISECIATQVRLVWPPREGFAEDEIVAAEAPRFVPMLRMSAENYRSGNWAQALQAAIGLPISRERMDANGAAACAEFLLQPIP